MKKNIFFASFAAVILLAFGTIVVRAANWQAPSDNFPGGNPAAPLDTGNLDQIKLGALQIGSVNIGSSTLGNVYFGNNAILRSISGGGLFFDLKNGPFNIYNSKGLILPNTTVGAASTSTGTMIYDTASSTVKIYSGGKWNTVGEGDNGGSFLPWKNFNSSYTGWIKLSTPIVHNEGNMFRIHVFGYKYSNSSDPNTIDIVCTGYAYTGSTLIKTRCNTEGTDLPVEIGTETRSEQGNKKVVVIRLGSPTQKWYYPQLTAEYLGWNTKNPADFKWITNETTPAVSDNTNNVYINDQGDSYFNIGNIGIGKIDPLATLDVNGQIKAESQIWGGEGIFSTSSRGMIFDAGASTSWNLLQLKNNNVNAMTVLGSGNVGIGTTSPSSGYILHTNGNILVGGTINTEKSLVMATYGGTTNVGSRATIKTSNQGGLNLINDVSNAYTSFSNWNGSKIEEQMKIVGSTGNVGIGTAEPKEKLVVQGNIKADLNGVALYRYNYNSYDNNYTTPSGFTTKCSCDIGDQDECSTAGELLLPENNAGCYDHWTSPVNGNKFTNKFKRVNTTPVLGGGAAYFSSQVGIGNLSTDGWNPSLTLITTNDSEPSNYSLVNSAGELNFVNNSNQKKISITQNGYFGIGIDNPPTLFTIASSSINIFNVTDTGKVGIGTSTPAAMLHVAKGNSRQSPINVDGLFVESDGNKDNYFVLQTASKGGGKSFSITNSGNVGIGTSTPAAMLHVSGDTRLDGDLCFGNCDKTSTTTEIDYNKFGTHGYREFLLDDTNTAFTVPNHISQLFVNIWGGGGGGGGGGRTTRESRPDGGSGGGGGSGGFAQAVIFVIPGSTHTVTVGKGGTMGRGTSDCTGDDNGSNGGDGLDSSIGNIITATGGKGGTKGLCDGDGKGYGGQGGSSSSDNNFIYGIGRKSVSGTDGKSEGGDLDSVGIGGSSGTDIGKGGNGGRGGYGGTGGVSNGKNGDAGTDGKVIIWW